jgi:7-cyano-7-deazaguanine synthase
LTRLLRCVVLLSGGLDSATLLAVARRDGWETYALSFDYGQRHAHELAAARLVAQQLGAARHHVLPLDLRAFGGSALTSEVAVPKGRSEAEMGASIPITYVPARNTIFLSVALAWAEVLGAQAIYIGVNALDYAGYPDCRPEYLDAFERMANLATKASVEEGRELHIHAPLVDLSKAEIIRLGLGLGVDYSLTSSCYDPGPAGLACGECDACVLRLRAFGQLGVPDPVRHSER